MFQKHTYHLSDYSFHFLKKKLVQEKKKKMLDSSPDFMAIQNGSSSLQKANEAKNQ